MNINTYLDTLDAYAARNPDTQASIEGMREGIRIADANFGNIIPLVLKVEGKEVGGLGVIDIAANNQPVLRIIAIAPHPDWEIQEMIITGGSSGRSVELKEGEKFADISVSTH